MSPCLTVLCPSLPSGNSITVRAPKTAAARQGRRAGTKLLDDSSLPVEEGDIERETHPKHVHRGARIQDQGFTLLGTLIRPRSPLARLKKEAATLALSAKASPSVGFPRSKAQQLIPYHSGGAGTASKAKLTLMVVTPEKTLTPGLARPCRSDGPKAALRRRRRLEDDRIDALGYSGDVVNQPTAVVTAFLSGLSLR